MEPFTHQKDIDIEILSHLDDISLELVCESNTYLNTLCHDSYLWKIKILNKYPGFPIDYNDDYVLYKKLYFNLIHREYTDIMIWADKHNNNSIINWLIYNKDYHTYFSNNISTMLNQNDQFRGDQPQKIILLDKLFMFIYNNRFKLIIFQALGNIIKDRLIALSNTVYYKEQAQLFLKLIFD